MDASLPEKALGSSFVPASDGRKKRYAVVILLSLFDLAALGVLFYVQTTEMSMGLFAESSSVAATTVPPSQGNDQHLAAAYSSFSKYNRRASSMSSVRGRATSSASSKRTLKSLFLFRKLPEEKRGLIDAKPPVRFDNQVGVYLTAASMGRKEFLDETFKRLEETGATALVFDVKGSNIYFQSAPARATELTLVRPIYDLKEITARAREKGIYTIGRFISLKDPLFSSLEPESQIRHPKTGIAVGGGMWVDGSTPATIEYNRQIMRELLQYDIDEVNLDYIRYPTEYAQVSIGLTGKEKADRIEPFIRMMRESINEINPDVKLGLSTYAIMGWNYPINLEAIGQDFVRYAPLVDVISPMAYPATFAEGHYYIPGKHPRSRMYYLVYRTMTGYAELLGPEHKGKLRPWIQGYYVDQADMREQIDAVYDSGACGYTVWNANNNYGPVYLAIKATTTKPDRCL